MSHLAGVLMNSRHGNQGERGPVSYTQKELTTAGRDAFAADRDQLLAEARMVLGV